MARDQKIAGKIGAPPPPGAPVQTTQPLDAAAMNAALRAAGANEKTLAPLNFSSASRVPAAVPPRPDVSAEVALPAAAVPRGTPIVPAAVPGALPGAVSGAVPAAVPAAAPETGVAGGSAPSVAPAGDGSAPPESPSAPGSAPAGVESPAGAAELHGDAAATAVAEAFAALRAQREAVPAAAGDADIRRPAQSDTDSPARGIPRAILDPNKTIAGGFGAVGEASYFPLDGLELKALAQGLLGTIADQIEHDLRFSIAVCYPRVRVRAELIVEAYAVDAWTVARVAPAHEKTALETAQALADQVVFVVQAQRQEFDASGNVESPANAIRGELGLAPPRKQIVETPTGRMLVDVRTDGGT